MAHRIAFIQRNSDNSKRGWVCGTSWSHLCISGKMRILPTAIDTCNVDGCTIALADIAAEWEKLKKKGWFEAGCAFAGNLIWGVLLPTTNKLKKAKKAKKPKIKKAK